MKVLIKLLLQSLAVLVAANLVPGVTVDSFITAAIVAVVLGILNTFIKPVLTILTLPITIFTLGLFALVINVLMVYFTDYLITGFSVSGFISALLFSLALSLVSAFLNALS